MINKNSLIASILPMLTLLICLTVFTPQVVAVVLRHDQGDAEALLFGRRFDAVGRVLPDGGCTLVAPTWAVTAAHVAASIPPNGKIQFGDKKYAVKQTVLHPKGKGQPGRPPEVDLALVELAERVADITPVELFKAKDELGKTLFIVGYGDYGNPKSRLNRTDGKRRAATN
jgi:hypothetical protein